MAWIRCEHSDVLVSTHKTERDAFGDDEYHPIKRRGQNLSQAVGGIGYMISDALDTMLIMGLTDEYKRARKWVSSRLTFERDAEFSTFEVCILQFPVRR